MNGAYCIWLLFVHKLAAGIFTAGLEPKDKLLRLGPGAGGAEAGYWQQLASICSLLAVAGLGIFLTLCPGRCPGSANAAAGLSRSALRGWWCAALVMQGLELQESFNRALASSIQ